MIRDRINRHLPAGLKIGFGTLYVHTDRGTSLIERVSQWRYIDRWHDAGVLTFVAMMFASLSAMIWVGLRTVQTTPEPTAAQQPTNLVAIPGVNDFLPWSAAAYILVVLLIAAFAHEIAHGVAMRAEDVTLEEVGVAFLLGIPIAAYVKPDDDEFESLSVWPKARILSAGVFANIGIFVVTTALFMLPHTGSVIDAFLTYFGVIFGGGIPTSSSVAGLGVTTNLLFWTWFFNLNLAFVNALPVVVLDGGRVAGLLGEVIETPYLSEIWVSRGIMATTTVVTLAAFIVAVFGPLFLS
jgi:membrane-associated protease RseP (regulator of RpoE activity)